MKEKLERVKELRKKGYSAELLWNSVTGACTIATWDARDLEDSKPERFDISIDEIADAIFPNGSQDEAFVERLTGELLKSDSPATKLVGDALRWYTYFDHKPGETNCAKR